MSEYSDLIKNGVLKCQYPPVLYKYYRLNKNLINTLEGRYLWFDSFDNYNDPYEGKCNVQTNYTNDEIIEWIRKIGGVMPSNKTAFSLFLHDFPVILRDKINNAAKETKICCFSKKNDDLLMWAHYADSHRGICVAFDTIKLAESLSLLLLPVKYEKKYPTVDYLNNPQDTINQMVLSKADVWRYEKEYRFVAPYCSKNKISFDLRALKSVVIGCKCDRESEIYHEMLCLLPSWVSVHDSEVNGNSYRLMIK